MRAREVLFFAKKKYFFLPKISTFFYKKKYFFLQKKVHFFPKKSTFFWQKKVFFLIKKYIFLLDCLLINEFSDVLCNIKGAPKPDLYLQLLSIPKMLLMLPAPGARVDDEANLRWRWTNKEVFAGRAGPLCPKLSKFAPCILHCQACTVKDLK